VDLKIIDDHEMDPNRKLVINKSGRVQAH